MSRKVVYRKVIFAFFLTLVSGQVLADKTLMDCANIDDATARVQCYDKIAGRVQKTIKENKAQEGTTKQRREQEEKTRDIVVKQVMGEDATSKDDIANLTIKSVTKDFNGRPIFATTDGRFFKRDTSTPLSFHKGDKVRLEEGFMGSAFLVREDGLRIKVKELESSHR